jgi:aminoglycoside phosphotransferase family enzyme/predicted kinase
MIVQDQSEVFEFLARPDTHGGMDVEREETHISEVFLSGDRVFKLKRAVNLPYVDFSTPELRLDACKREVELNRRTAPDLYLGVKEIFRADDGSLGFSGPGKLVDAVVEMVRFGPGALFDKLARSGELTPALLRRTADAISAFHKDLSPNRSVGGAQAMEKVLDINERALATSHFFNAVEIASFNKSFRAGFERHRVLLDRRGREGRVVLGHGDLHLRNICLFNGRPVLFDCIEFNDDIATVDVLYDLSFLLMDLWHRGHPGYANLVANRYFDNTGDEEGYCLLPYFMAVRAAVRAHVTATQIEEAGHTDEVLGSRARSYFELAKNLLQSGPVRILAVGGLSGSGKSHVAEAIAHEIGVPPGARILESDRIRKRLFDVSPETKLPDSAYKVETSEKVYAGITEKAKILLKDGNCVVADAVYSDPDRRAAIENAANGLNAPFTGIWLDAPANVLRSRVAGRTGDASDADIAVLERQLKSIGPVDDWQTVDATRPIEEIAGEILAKPFRATD